MRRVFSFVLLVVVALLLCFPIITHPLLPADSVHLPLVMGGATPAPSPTPTGTLAPGDLNLYGLVYDAKGGTSMPIAGARVAALLCLPRAFSELADQNGRYGLFVPSSYANACGQLNLEVSAAGYATFNQRYDVSDLQLHPRRDFALEPLVRPSPTATHAAPIAAPAAE